MKFSKINKLWFIWTVIIIAVILFLVGFIILIENYDSIRTYLQNRKDQMLYDAYTAPFIEMENRHKADNIGSSTPEGTVLMLLDALKQNDPVKSASFYYVKIKDQALVNFKNELKENGNLNQSYEFTNDVFTKGIKTCKDIDKSYGGCVFRYKFVLDKDLISNIEGTKDSIHYIKGSTISHITELELNPYTNVWKVSFPY